MSFFLIKDKILSFSHCLMLHIVTDGHFVNVRNLFSLIRKTFFSEHKWTNFLRNKFMKGKAFLPQAQCCTTFDAHCYQSPASSPPPTVICHLQSSVSFHLLFLSPMRFIFAWVTSCSVPSYQRGLSATRCVFSVYSLKIMWSVFLSHQLPLSDLGITAICGCIRDLYLSENQSERCVMQMVRGDGHRSKRIIRLFSHFQFVLNRPHAQVQAF